MQLILTLINQEPLRLIEDQSVIYNTGPTLKLNNVNRTPSVGIGSTYVLSLRDERVGPDVDADGAPGNEIGLARVYDFRIESGAYDTANADLNQWGIISLYDVQSFTTLTLNQATARLSRFLHLLKDKEVVQLHLLDLQCLIVKQLLYMKLKESLLLTNHFSLMVFLMEESLLLPLLMVLAM